MKFDDIIGNDSIKNMLVKSIKKNNISNTYLFIGQEGIGKRTIAEEFSRMILCVSENKTQCDNCNSCVKFKTLNHPDFLEIVPDGLSIKINQMREMQSNIYQKPIISSKKVFIVNDAEKMTEEAQNSLLKILEEPPKYAVIILIVSNENLMLNTIKSRCMKINFKNLNNEELTQYINKNDLIKNPSQNIISICNGSVGKVEVIKNDIEKYKQLENLLKDIVEKRQTFLPDIISSAGCLYSSKDNIKYILDYMMIVMYNKIESNVFLYAKIINMIEQTKIKLNSNSNFEMCIDSLLINIWEEVNEKYSRNKI